MRNKKAYRNIGIVMVIGGVGYFLIKSIGNKKMYEKIAEAIGGPAGSSSAQFNSWFDPDYHKNASDGKFVYKKQRHAVVNKWGDDIYDAKGYVYDTEDTVYSVFRSMPDAVAVSQTSDKFQKEYSRDLLEYIKSFLNKTQLNTLYKILETKPKVRATHSITETIIT